MAIGRIATRCVYYLQTIILLSLVLYANKCKRESVYLA